MALPVLLCIVIPVAIAQVLRGRVLATGGQAAGGQAALDRLLRVLRPVSLISLLTTLVLLFRFQGEQLLAQPLVIVLLAVPILIQVYFNAASPTGSAASSAWPGASLRQLR